ncbi:hypothetical protein [Caballeronia sp. J97]|uniref:hypothetical protein n=1 Tax=Caballeronia sp. J97 TaxID=2805429 RepID=UPI002AB12272|nr:hypothetical protein [Caballeronia sp. J97]
MNPIKDSTTNQALPVRLSLDYPLRETANGSGQSASEAARSANHAPRLDARVPQTASTTAELFSAGIPPLSELPYCQTPLVVRVAVSPALAERWLGSNHGNRFVKPRLVRYYAQQMKSGRWRLNGECIKFATDGSMIDGQHRLNGVVQSGVTVEMEVRVGLDRDAALTVDTGAARTAADVMSMRGLTHWEADALGAAIKLLVNHERGGAMWTAWRGDNQDMFEGGAVGHALEHVVGEDASVVALQKGADGVELFIGEAFDGEHRERPGVAGMAAHAHEEAEAFVARGGDRGVEQGVHVREVVVRCDGFTVAYHRQPIE